MKTYTTEQGDMWDSVANKQLGSAAYADRLMRANRQYLGFYIFPAGIVLSLPEIPQSSSVSGSLPPWKREK